MASKLSGIEPSSLFPDMLREFNELISEIDWGIFPDREFQARFKSTSLAQLPSSGGIEPVKEFTSTCKEDNCFRDPIQAPSNEDALHSPLQVGGNSHVQDEHEQDENQDTLLEVEQKRSPTHKGAWLVDVIDDQCKMTTKHLKTNAVWNLPQNERIIVHWNEEYQPIGVGGALLNQFLGSIARNFKEIALKNKQPLAHTGGDPRALQGREKKWKKSVGTKLAEEKFG
ncbi:hypothetical protein LR48_Vigan08g092600 [Vigna angularis]|uniref:Uncharacterized protein n=1 Tax=Phaseolus angularis TaxID=3914 RepID=A0A0L9V5Z2_PHAAN|nr:hypothetical protein LR48_Vigan08g092600 [Vigna angularis]